MFSCCPMPLKEKFIEFRWNTPPLLLQEPTPPPEIHQLATLHPTYPIKPSRLLQDYLEWDQDENKVNLNLYKRMDLIKEPWHADSQVEINLWMNDHPEYIYIPQDRWLPYLTVMFLTPHKPIAPHLLSIHIAELEVLPWYHHLIRISQLYRLLQLPIHCPLPGQKYSHQVTPFTIQTAESGATFIINGLCYFDETISQCYESAGFQSTRVPQSKETEK